MGENDTSDPQLKLSIGKQNLYVLRSNFQNSTWSYVLYSMVAHALSPILVPCMIILSKILGREIHFGNYTP